MPLNAKIPVVLQLRHGFIGIISRLWNSTSIFPGRWICKLSNSLVRPPVGNTEHEKPAVADFIRAGESGGNASDFVVVKGSCAFHSVL